MTRQVQSDLAPAGFDGDPNFMLSLARGLTVLQAFGMKEGPLSVSEVARLTLLPRATARRCLYTLEKIGYVSQHDSRYALQSAILPMARQFLLGQSPGQSIQGVLDELRDRFDLGCAVGRLDGAFVVQAWVSRPGGARWSGAARNLRIPAFCSSMGCVLLADLSDDAVDAVLSGFPLARLTEFTVTDPEEIRRKLRQVQADGYAINDQEVDLGRRAVSMPIKNDRGQVIGALNVRGAAQQLPDQAVRADMLPVMRRAAEEIALYLSAV